MTASPALFRPRSLAEAFDLLAAHQDSKPISGGASLVAMMNAGLVAPAALISLTRIPELSGISVTGEGSIRIGAATRHNDIAVDRRLVGTATVVAQAASQIGSVAVRNMGTIGGAVAHADPGLDFPPALMAIEASVEIASIAGRRSVPIREFFVDWYSTALDPGEIVVRSISPSRNPASASILSTPGCPATTPSSRSPSRWRATARFTLPSAVADRPRWPRAKWTACCQPICPPLSRLAPPTSWWRWRIRSTTFAAPPNTAKS